MKLSLISILNEITARKGPRTGVLELDYDEIHSVASKIADDLQKDIKDGEIRYHMYKASPISSISGEESPVEILVQEPYNEDTPDAFYSSKLHKIFLMIQKSPYIEVLQYNKKKFVDFIANMIIHEVTHSLDPQVSSKLSKLSYDQEKYNKEYWNTRMETKAYLQQIHSEIFDELHHLKIKATYNNMAAISLENFVKRLKKKPEIILLLSETWKKIKHLIDDKKVKRKYYLMAWHIAPKVLEELSET